MDKPDVDFIEGLSPAVSIDQKSTSRNPRCTVGTITEVYDYLRLLYARAGRPHCPKCGRPISRQTPQQIVDRVLEMAEGTRFQVLAPVVRGRKGEYVDLFGELQAKGFSRVRVDGVVHSLTDPPKLKKQEKHTIEVVVDRLVGARVVQAAGSPTRWRPRSAWPTGWSSSTSSTCRRTTRTGSARFSEHLACPNDDLSFEALEPRSFSFNSPYGACPECTGLGTRKEVDPELVVPDPERTLRRGRDLARGAAGRPATTSSGCSRRSATRSASPSTPRGSGCRPRAQKAVLHGHDQQVHVRYRNRYGRQRSYYADVRGRHAVPGAPARADRLGLRAGRSTRATCGRCPARPAAAPGSSRRSLAVTLGAATVDRRAVRDVDRRRAPSSSPALVLSERERMIAERVLKEVHARLGFLLDVGLDYLSLDRPAATLSGGEAQRIRLATQIGSGLVGVLYVLDEPSIGLHQRDNRRLIQTLIRLRDLGNTLIVVEHDEDTIRTADWVVDIGPGAGEHGGEVVRVRHGRRPGGVRASR